MHSQVAPPCPEDLTWMSAALRLAKRGFGSTSPNPLVGAVIVRDGKLLGQGWHRRAGEPHAEVEAIRDATKTGHSLRGSTLYVTLEPCSTEGRTPPCTEAILAQGVARVVVAATDPNPKHCGRGLDLLRQAGVTVVEGVREAEALRMNEAFNHWIVARTPWVTVKAAMTLDGKIATATGESKWITSVASRTYAMRLRQGADAILVGVNTVLCDDPQLTVRRGDRPTGKRLKRLVLDAAARTPLSSKLVSDEYADWTTVIVAQDAPSHRLKALAKQVDVQVAPAEEGKIDLAWLLSMLGRESVTSLLVEGGGEVNSSFLLGGFAQRVAFFYAPKILGGRTAPGAVGGDGIESLSRILTLKDMEWRRLGTDFLLTGRLSGAHAG